MKKERKIINTNIRLNLMNEQDRQAWNYLRGMDRKKYKSYTKAVVLALNDYFSRQEQIEADPYLETRKQEDEFLNSVEEAVEESKKYEGEVFVIGGESIYRAMLPYCDTALVTKIDHAFDADTYFPSLDQDDEWQMIKISEEQTCFDLEYYFQKYVRKQRRSGSCPIGSTPSLRRPVHK